MDRPTFVKIFQHDFVLCSNFSKTKHIELKFLMNIFREGVNELRMSFHFPNWSKNSGEFQMEILLMFSQCPVKHAKLKCPVSLLLFVVFCLLSFTFKIPQKPQKVNTLNQMMNFTFENTCIFHDKYEFFRWNISKCKVCVFFPPLRINICRLFFRLVYSFTKWAERCIAFSVFFQNINTTIHWQLMGFHAAFCVNQNIFLGWKMITTRWRANYHFEAM